MSAPTVGPCSPWITDDDLDPGTCCADEPTLTRAATISSTILFRLSGRQFPGICERVVRPCGTGCSTWQAWPGYRNHWWNAERTAAGGWQQGDSWPPLRGVCGGGCHVPSVTLPGPVAAINEVLVDGDVVDPAAYRVRQYRYLERIDGYSWPCWQDLTADTDAVGTFQVTYPCGRLPGVDGLAAAGQYACELAKAMCPTAVDGECKLPERTRTLVRQGVTIDIETPLDFLDNGRTGLAFVDAWLASVNPANLPRRATVSRIG